TSPGAGPASAKAAARRRAPAQTAAVCLRRFRSGSAEDVPRLNRPARAHHQRVRDAIEYAEHEDQSVALFWQLHYVGCELPHRRIDDRAAIAEERKHVTELDAVGAAAVECNNRKLPGFTDRGEAAVKRYDAALHVCGGCMRRIAHNVRPSRGHEAIANADLLGHRRDLDCG